jgi:hypothetical protein
MMLGSGAVYLYAIVFSLVFPYFNDQWSTPPFASLPPLHMEAWA